MAKRETVTLYGPSGDEKQTATPSDVVRLKAIGYTEKKPTKAAAKAAPSKSATGGGSDS